MSAFSPGMILSAIENEAIKVAALAGSRGGVMRVPTATTALTQHCLCGARVSKTLADRVHRCDACALVGDRDAVAAVLASFIARDANVVDFNASRSSLNDTFRSILSETVVSAKGRQDAPSESTAPPGGDGFSNAATGPSPDFVAARRNADDAVRTTPDETDLDGETKSDRPHARSSLHPNGHAPLRDSS
jgi:hypothetical protein